MESPLSPVNANQFMIEFERKALRTAGLASIYRIGIENWMDSYNTSELITLNIRFTVEIEKYNKPSILDITIYKH